MKAKLITVAMGAVLLATGTLAMAHDGRDRDDGWRREQWREHQWREHEWREHHHPRWHREYYRYEPRYVPVPVPVPDTHYRSSYPYGYDRDGVSIILRGRIN
jgi:hypothetical protein